MSVFVCIFLVSTELAKCTSGGFHLKHRANLIPILIHFHFYFHLLKMSWRVYGAAKVAQLTFLLIVIPPIWLPHSFSLYVFSLRFHRIRLHEKGPVSFSGADRVGISVFSQVQDGRLQSVALFHPSQLHLDFDCLKCVPIKWKNGQVPIAKRVFKLRVATVSPIAFFIVSTLALIGIILSIAFVAFNLHFRKLK